MNPMTNMKNVKKLSEQELTFGMKTSWHDQYKHSAWIFVGGLPFDLTEGDIICVFSQYGEVVNINLVRDKGTGKSRGFCFICYEDQRSTNLAVDNFNGIKLLNRTIRVDHCEGYKAPKDDKMDEESRSLHAEGCAPGSKFGALPKLPSSSDSNGGLDKGFNLPPMESLLKLKTEKEDFPKKHKEKTEKREKNVKKTKDKIKKLFRKKKKEESSSSSSSSDSSSESEEEKSGKKRTKKEKSKRRRNGSSSSSGEESDSNNSKRKLKKKLRKDSSSDSDSDTDGKPQDKKKGKPRKRLIKNKSPESEDEDQVKTTESSQRFHKSSRDEAISVSGINKHDRDSNKYRNELAEKSTDKDRKFSAENNRDNLRRHGNDSKSRDDGRHDRDRRDDRDRKDDRNWKPDQDRRDDRGRRDDRNRRDDNDRKYSGEKNQEDSRRYDYGRKERDRR